MYIILIVLLCLVGDSVSQSDKPTLDDLYTSPYLVEGKKFSITCQISSNHGPYAFEWLFNGKQILSDDNVVILNQLDDSSLLNIKSMSSKHNGQYTCNLKDLKNADILQDSKSIMIRLNGKTVSL